MKKILVLFVFCSIGMITKAQDYRNAIGIRGGFSSGITFKHLKSNNRGFEGILSWHPSGFTITGLYEVHKAAAFGTPRLNWYYGGGAHIGFYNDRPRYYRYYPDYPNRTFVAMGADGIIGIEYNIREIPLNFSFDLIPRLNLLYPAFWVDPGLSIRLYF